MKGLRKRAGRGTLARRRIRVGYPRGRSRITPVERRRRAEERARLAAWVRLARDLLGVPAEGSYPGVPLSQDGLAELLGCSRSLVAAWEAATKRPTLEAVAAIEALLRDAGESTDGNRS